MLAVRRAGLLLAAVLVALWLAAAPAGAVVAGNTASRQFSPDVAAPAPSAACRASSGAVGYVLSAKRATGSSFQRYYDPGTGQFMSLDPLNAMTNAGYTFVNDDPLVGSDPSGTIGYRTCGESCEANGPPPPNMGPPSQPTAASSSPDAITTSSSQWMCNGTQCTPHLGMVTTSQPSFLAVHEGHTAPTLSEIGLGFLPDAAEVRAAAFASELAMLENGAAVDAALTAPSTCLICSAGHFIVHHWRGELQIAGLVATVLSAGTGGAAFFGADALGDAADTLATVSNISSAVSGLTSIPACASNPSGNMTSCAGAAIGVFGGGLGQLSAAGAITDLIPGLLKSSSFAVGAASLAWTSIILAAGR